MDRLDELEREAKADVMAGNIQVESIATRIALKRSRDKAIDILALIACVRAADAMKSSYVNPQRGDWPKIVKAYDKARAALGAKQEGAT